MLVFAERDYGAKVAIWDDEFMTAFSGNRGFLAQRETNLAFAHELAGNEEAARAEAEKGLALLDAAPDIGGYSQSMELGTRGLLLTFLDRHEEAIAACDDAISILTIVAVVVGPIRRR